MLRTKYLEEKIDSIDQLISTTPDTEMGDLYIKHLRRLRTAYRREAGKRETKPQTEFYISAEHKGPYKRKDA